MPDAFGMVAGAIPYPWPYDGRLVPRRTALVVVAAQAGSAGLDPNGQVAGRCRTLRAAAARAGLWLCMVHLADPAASHRRRGPAGAAQGGGPPLAGLEPDEQTLVVTTPGLDGFFGTILDAALWNRGISHLVLAGFGTETAVHSTLRSANDRGFECLTVSDACADGDPGLHTAAFSSLMMSGGIFGAHATTAAVLEVLAH